MSWSVMDNPATPEEIKQWEAQQQKDSQAEDFEREIDAAKNPGANDDGTSPAAAKERR